jgi:hypothetical protein
LAGVGYVLNFWQMPSENGNFFVIDHARPAEIRATLEPVIARRGRPAA